MRKKIGAAIVALTIGSATLIAGPAFAEDAPLEEVAAPAEEIVLVDEPVAPAAPEESARVVESLVVADPPVDETPFVLIAWPMPTWINATTPSWPQGIGSTGIAPVTVDLATRNLDALDATLAALVTCETTVQWQIDGNYDTAPVRAAIAGGNLYGSNDPAEALWGGGWGEAYKLVQIVGPKCEKPPVECVSSGAWGTEADDTAPVQTADGLVFTGGSGSAVGYGTPITGNLQGLGEITVSATGDLDVFYPRIVINSLADGGYAYDSLTVISEGPVNGSSIAASNKRGFEQHTLDEWAALLPSNELVAFFLHLDSAATAEQTVTVTAVSGECLNLDTVPEVDTPEEPTPPTSVKAGDAQIPPLAYAFLALLLAALAAYAGVRIPRKQ